MHIVTRLIAMNRARQLTRQLREIQRLVYALPDKSRSRLGALALREIGVASRSDFPHLHGTTADERYMPWGQGTEIGMAKARSDNPEISMRGIALWMATAYHETKDTPHPNLKPQHRQLMRMLRELKEDFSRDPAQKQQWAADAAAVAA